jgi:hypothetical protein
MNLNTTISWLSLSSEFTKTKTLKKKTLIHNTDQDFQVIKELCKMPYSSILKINWLKLWMIFQAHYMCSSSKQLFSLPNRWIPNCEGVLVPIEVELLSVTSTVFSLYLYIYIYMHIWASHCFALPVTMILIFIVDIIILLFFFFSKDKIL